MDRRIFMGGLIGASVMGFILKSEESKSTRMPVLFIGHGSPMNAIEKNSFTDFLNQAPGLYPEPKVILAISAHWETRGTKVLKVALPETIHDFGGFPQALFDVQYPAPGSPETADKIVDLVKLHEVTTSHDWGLDHGTWSVLKHMYPKANIPVLQLSLNQNMNFEQHMELARELTALRDQGVLIVGSGNITHNLRRVDWKNGAPMDWALEFDGLIKQALLDRNESFLLARETKDRALWNIAHPSLEHYLPLLYTYGASTKNEQAKFIFEGIQMGSLSMRSVMFG
jgi:4,5-DOPA dioxygenase extradiol